ncbi:uncharacterized [Tachysurus ichikawai]
MSACCGSRVCLPPHKDCAYLERAAQKQRGSSTCHQENCLLVWFTRQMNSTERDGLCSSGKESVDTRNCHQPYRSIRANENTKRGRADAITSTANKQREGEEKRVFVISQSRCPLVQAPVPLGEGDRMKRGCLAPGLCNTFMPHQEQDNHSVTSPTHTHLTDIVSYSATSDTIACPDRKQ